MTSELRPALTVWADALEAFDMIYGGTDAHELAAAAVIEAALEAVRAPLLAEIARLRKELSDMATKYSCAVDTFNTGFSGYEAVLLHQRRIADEGPPANWKDGMKAYAARAALAGENNG